MSPGIKRRYGQVICLNPERVEEYKRLHVAAWPGVQAKITECNIRNFSAFLRQLDDGNPYLFGYFEYMGGDFDADMKKMAADPVTQQWWELCRPCQRPLKGLLENAWWADMEEVFYCA